MLSPRESGALIASRAEHVRVDEAAAEECARFILEEAGDEGELAMTKFTNVDLHPQVANEAGANWLFFANTLNFSFWNKENEPQYEVTYKGKKYTGYMSLCAALNRTLDRGINLTDPSAFGEVGERDLNSYLMGDEAVPCPMVKERFECLQDASKVLKEKYEGSVAQLIKTGEKSAQKLLATIGSDFKCYQDCATLSDGTRVSFYKRAQIFISDLWSLFDGKGLGEFHDMDTLTMFADYRVPQSLQYFGVFKYSEELLDKLRSEELLENGSEMEVEIRGCSIRAVELVTSALKRMRPEMAMSDVLVDYFLWGFRRRKAKEMEKFPYHKTRSIYY